MALTTQQQILQNQIDALDSSATTESLLKILNQSIAAGTIMWGYDSASVMPTDSDYIGMIAFSNRDSDLYFHGTDLNWHVIDSAAVIPVALAMLQGENYGYALGAPANQIQKFSFTSDGNSTDVGDFLSPTTSTLGMAASSPTHGYYAGGTDPSGPAATDTIQKFPTAVDANTTDVGNLPGRRYRGASSMSATYGYTQGGETPSDPTEYPRGSVEITKYPFASDADAVVSASLITYAPAPGYRFISGGSSPTHGYSYGGEGGSDPSAIENTIQKHTFASDGDATDVGDLLTLLYRSSGNQQSDASIYTTGGDSPPATPTKVNTIQKWSISTDGNSTDVGDLNQALSYTAGNSSTTHGYTFGGNYPPSRNFIQKFPFSTDTNSTDIGDLLAVSASLEGAQN